MSLINQPFNGQLGEILISKLQENYNRLTILVAFAKNSGVLRIKPALEILRKLAVILQYWWVSTSKVHLMKHCRICYRFAMICM